MQPLRTMSSWITALLLGSALSACAYIIPPDQNEPRNNTVQGEIRRPINNPSSDRRSEVTPRNTPMSAPVRAVQQSALPPTNATSSLRAQEPASASPVLSSGRRIPVQNPQFQLGSNGYPEINSVPSAPITTGSDSPQSRLNAAQAELEADRAKAGVAADALVKDAAAEPSMLSDLPKIDGVVPPNDPIQSLPTVQETPPVVPQPVPQQKSEVVPAVAEPSPTVSKVVSSVTPETVPAEKPITSGIATQKQLAPVVSDNATGLREFAAPAPLASRTAESATTPVAPASVASSPASAAAVEKSAAALPAEAPAPAVVVPPASPVAPAKKLSATLPPEAVVPVAGQPTIVAKPLPALAHAAQAAPTKRAGDFDPLAVADNAPINSAVAVSSRSPLSPSYVVNRYIPPSRYSGLRN